MNKIMLIRSAPIDEGTIDKYIKESLRDVDFYSISEYQKLSEKFIEKYKNKLNWTFICVYQKLSESFIESNKKYIDFFSISKYQPLSETFIKKYFKKLNSELIFKHQRLSHEFIEDYINSDTDYFLQDLYKEYIENNWIYKSTEEKKKAVMDTGLYECHEDYFIAYKAIRADRYSLYNFQYKYEPGGVYESWCDCSNNENSFGLSVGTEKYANNYSSYLSNNERLIVKCKVFYEDVGRVVYDGNKIRCFKIEILN